MNSIGFIISHKNHEDRRAIIPTDIDDIKNTRQLNFESGYGEAIGYSDNNYLEKDVNIVNRQEVFDCDIIVDVKLGDADYLETLKPGKVLIGWAHAVQNVTFTDIMIENQHTVVAWEEMYEYGRYVFYRNREIAGEAAVIQAIPYCGKMPDDIKAAIIGNGQTARGAYRVLTALGAKVDIYTRKLEQLFKRKLAEYDVLINCVFWDVTRTDKLIYRHDLKRLKKGTMIIDISCDPHLEIETSHPTTIEDPVYVIDGIIHYAVDNTPAMYPITVSSVLSNENKRYIDDLVEGNWPDILRNSVVIEKGRITDEKILRFRQARGLYCQ